MEARPPADPDSRTRTHLANERTFLAWFRTGIGVMALGLGAAQFLAPNVADRVPLVRLLATALVATGVILILGGAFRYAAERRRIDASEFRPAAGSILAAVVLAVVIAIFAIAFVWLVRR